MSEITVRDESPYSLEAMKLVEEMWFDLGALYGDVGPCRFKPEDLDHVRGAFVMAWLNGVPAGCGAIKPLETNDVEAAEIKRMFVRPNMRRCGVASSVLAALESRARELIYSVVRLETGTLQPEAMALYESQGYTRIDCYGRYATDPMSVCYEKRLS